MQGEGKCEGSPGSVKMCAFSHAHASVGLHGLLGHAVFLWQVCTKDEKRHECELWLRRDVVGTNGMGDACTLLDLALEN